MSVPSPARPSAALKRGDRLRLTPDLVKILWQAISAGEDHVAVTKVTRQADGGGKDVRIDVRRGDPLPDEETDQ